MTAQTAELPKCSMPHDFETEVRRELMATEGMKVSSLVVRRLPNGVCLQGVVRFDDESVNICDVLKRIPGVHEVLNQMLVCQDRDLEK